MYNYYMPRENIIRNEISSCKSKKDDIKTGEHGSQRKGAGRTERNRRAQETQVMERRGRR